MDALDSSEKLALEKAVASRASSSEGERKQGAVPERRWCWVKDWRRLGSCSADRRVRSWRERSLKAALYAAYLMRTATPGKESSSWERSGCSQEVRVTGLPLWSLDTTR